MTESCNSSSSLRASMARLSRVRGVEMRLMDSVVDGEQVGTVVDVLRCSVLELVVEILQSRLRDAIEGRFHTFEEWSEQTLGCC